MDPPVSFSLAYFSKGVYTKLITNQRRTNMLVEKAREYYLAHDANCAEAIVKAANDCYGLGLDEKALKLVSGYGKGFGVGTTCGALAGAMAVVSLLFVGDRAHATPGFDDACTGLMSAYEEKLKSTNCNELKGLYRTEENRCLKTVELSAQVLEDYLVSKGKVTL